MEENDSNLEMGSSSPPNGEVIKIVALNDIDKSGNPKLSIMAEYNNSAVMARKLARSEFDMILNILYRL